MDVETYRLRILSCCTRGRRTRRHTRFLPSKLGHLRHQWMRSITVTRSLPALHRGRGCRGGFRELLGTPTCKTRKPHTPVALLRSNFSSPFLLILRELAGSGPAPILRWSPTRRPSTSTEECVAVDGFVQKMSLTRAPASQASLTASAQLRKAPGGLPPLI